MGLEPTSTRGVCGHLDALGVAMLSLGWNSLNSTVSRPVYHSGIPAQWSGEEDSNLQVLCQSNPPTQAEISQDFSRWAMICSETSGASTSEMLFAASRASFTARRSVATRSTSASLAARSMAPLW